ncbi:MAG: LL-diaminopimelate aminotransferase [Clostridia bacterium]|nr:LL-diaminopimelate aminotransferase [Clostridia bacterium]
MLMPNRNFSRIQKNYLFVNVEKKTESYRTCHPEKRIISLGIGDVTLPLGEVVTDAIHRAVEMQAHKETFRGYQDESGIRTFRSVIAGDYVNRGIPMKEEDIFISSGAADDLGNILLLFDDDNPVLVMTPAYPAYVDANLMDGREIKYIEANERNGFLPFPGADTEGDIIYLCSPNNPTGAAYDRNGLRRWVEHANNNGSIIIFDAAYEAYITDPDIPHSIYEIEGARDCAIEIRSFSKSAGFTGMRLGYTVIPHELARGGFHLNSMYARARSTRSNGVSLILQEAGKALYTLEGQEYIHSSVSYYKKNGRIMMEALDDLGFDYVGGRNAPYIWLKCPKGFESWEFFDLMLEKLQIVGTPGVGFGPNGEGYFRLSTFGDHEDVKEAMARMRAFF